LVVVVWLTTGVLKKYLLLAATAACYCLLLLQK